MAFYWNSDELHQFDDHHSVLTDIFLYNTAGVKVHFGKTHHSKLAQIDGTEWSHSIIMAVGWTLSERLFVLLDDGRFFVFNLLGKLIKEIKLFSQSFTDLIATGVGFETGCVAYSRSGKL